MPDTREIMPICRVDSTDSYDGWRGVGAALVRGQWAALSPVVEMIQLRLMIQLHLFINDEHHSETLATWRVAVSRYL